MFFIISDKKMKQSIDSLQTPEEIFCEIISNLNEKNEIKIINNILSYLSPKEIVLISFQTTEKLKKIMTENENPFLKGNFTAVITTCCNTDSLCFPVVLCF